jgi:hypothetical protein
VSNQLKIAARRAFVRASGVIGHYPCFQTVAEGAFLIDRSGAGNGMTFGAGLTAANGWANANRLTTADNVSGTVAGSPYITGAALNWALATESMIIAGVVNIAAAPAATRHIIGNGSSTSVRGFAVRYNVTTGLASILAHGASTLFGTAGSNIATGADVHVAIAVDAPSQRAYLFVGGAFDATANGVAAYAVGTGGLDYSAQTANMVAACLANPLMVSGQAHTGTISLTPTAQSYGWQIAKRTGALPSNIEAVVKRMARHPLQVLTATEWPA